MAGKLADTFSAMNASSIGKSANLHLDLKAFFAFFRICG